MSHDKEGNRCLDVARSRYKFYLSSERGTYLGNSTWHFTNPAMRQVDNKYSGSSLVMLRAMTLDIDGPVLQTMGMLTVRLLGLSMPNTTECLAGSGVPKKAPNRMDQSCVVGVVNMRDGNIHGAKNADDDVSAGSAGGSPSDDPVKRWTQTSGERYSGSVAECGQLVAGDLVNSDITVQLRGIGKDHGTQAETNTFFEKSGKENTNSTWVCELEVQTLLNYNKHDSEY